MNIGKIELDNYEGLLLLLQGGCAKGLALQ